jgi:site-specific recombinase XerD
MPLSLDQHRRVLQKLNQWMRRCGIAVAELDEIRLQRFLRYWQRSKPCICHGRRILPRILAYLREQGVCTPAAQPQANPVEALLREFSDYLREERGLALCTIRRYGSMVRRFLQCEPGRNSAGPTDLCASGILEFIGRFGQAHGRHNAKDMVQALRAFLRWLHAEGRLNEDLSLVLPTVVSRRLTSVPCTLSPAQVHQLLRASKGTGALERRNRAILLLLARLGLRAGEIVGLRLGDINWRDGVILLRRKPGRDDRLPLPQDVGEALVAYLERARPRCSRREVFLCANAPMRPFSSSVTVSCIVAWALQRAGLDPPRGGAHLLRHSLASALVNKRTPMAEIGDLLGHRSLSATEIYTKIDLKNLRLVAQPWPGGIK